jgi:protein SCO1/2
MRAKSRVGAESWAALLVCALALWHLGMKPVRAHGIEPDSKSPDASATVAPNRWGANYFPNVTLATQDGNTVRFYDDLLKGKSVAVNIMYTSCRDECPLETARLVQLQRLLGDRMGRDIFFYSISIDPKHDTPEVLKAYMEKFGVGPGWLFLTGKPEDIRLATKKLGLSRYSDSANKDGHTAILMVGDEPTGQWMRNSAVDNPQFLATTIGNFLGWKDTKPGKSYAEARPLSVGQGEYLFNSRCTACHTIGQGDKMGPDLAGVTARRDRNWLARYVAEPDKVLADGDPIATALFEKYKDARMPNLRLGSADVNAVLAYLETKSSASREPVRKDSITGR